MVEIKNPVDEKAMAKMSVAPPDPKAGNQSDTPPDNVSGATASGVDDEDPLSAHPT
jgi:hypothetical protein